MEDSRIIKISLLISTLGLVFLFSMSWYLGPVEANIGDLDSSHLDMQVKIEGTVKKVSHHEEGHIFLVVGDSTGEIMVPVFDSLGFQKSLNEGDRVVIKGRLQEFRNKLEIVPSGREDIMCLKF